MIQLRKMTMEDADRMLEWKNYPETRKFAIVSHNEVKRDDHIKWLEKNVQYFQVITVDGEIAGAVRVYENEISIWIDRNFWSKGIATGVIKIVSKPGFKAKIVPENVPSMRAFIKAGYQIIDYVDGPTPYYILQR